MRSSAFWSKARSGAAEIPELRSGRNQRRHHLGKSGGSELFGIRRVRRGAARHLTDKQEAREIPKGQRLTGRPSLEKLFRERGKKKTAQDRQIADAVNQHGYSPIEVARHLDLHYSTVSRPIKNIADRENPRLRREY